MPSQNQERHAFGILKRQVLDFLLGDYESWGICFHALTTDGHHGKRRKTRTVDHQHLPSTDSWN